MNGDSGNQTLLRYDHWQGAEAFSTRRESILPYPVVTGHQVHGCKVAIVDRPDLTRDELEGYDAFVTDIPGCAVGVRTADCVPVLLYDPERRIVAAVHSGWKGTVKRICQETIRVMEDHFSCQAGDLRAIIGPSIAPESFQVGPEVVEQFRWQGFPIDEIWFFNQGTGKSPMYHGHHIDLIRANAWLLKEAGVCTNRIHTAGIDTYTDLSFFSARREGISCGRIISAVRILKG